MNIIVFDLGGTLMEFADMPPSWIDYYKQGFLNISEYFNCKISENDINKSVNIMKSFNPRINYRETEYTSQFIFENTLKHWNIDIDINAAAKIFFDGMNLSTVIYDDAIDILKYLKKNGYTICALTDIPSGMPDSYFQKNIRKLIEHIDFYVSSQSCGYRKPNTYGMKLISKKYNVEMKSFIFVGDEEKDKILAEKVRCKFFLIDRKNKKSAADIHNMKELKSILKI